MYMEHKLNQNHIACQIARGAAWNISGKHSSKHACDLRRRYSDLSEGNWFERRVTFATYLLKCILLGWRQLSNYNSIAIATLDLIEWHNYDMEVLVLVAMHTTCCSAKKLCMLVGSVEVWTKKTLDQFIEVQIHLACEEVAKMSSTVREPK